ncbi:MAG: YjbH domain-containing protein [Candidatus Sericytochromatia bacterium]|nr:YjbH domain-containing protein [Candidatus Tanganyikabacteria bacterium]
MNPLIWLLSATPSADPSVLGYTGLLHVPTAEVRQDATLAFRWLDAPEPLLQFPGTDRVNRTYSVILPFFPFLEGTLSFVQVVGWTDPEVPLLPYAVHRAFNAKARLPVDWAGPAVAAGVLDPVSANFLSSGGKLNTHYGLTTFYAVATQRLGPLSLTAGYGYGDRAEGKWGRTKPFLDGVFGGADLALPGGLDLLAEYDGITANYGARLALPWGFGLQGGFAGGGWTAGLAAAIRL